MFSAFIVNVTWHKITKPTKTIWLVPAYPLCLNIEPINRSNGSLLFHCKFWAFMKNQVPYTIKIGYYINAACLVVNPITVGKFAFLFNCRNSDSIFLWWFWLKSYLLIRWWGPNALAVVRHTGVYRLDFFAPVFSFMYCWVLIFA